MPMRKKSHVLIENDRLCAILHYDPTTGNWTWRYRSEQPARFNNRWAGRKASSVHSDGGNVIRADGFLYRANRLAWFYMKGEWPEHEVDHKDMDRSNDAWDNLRTATRSQNEANKHVQRNNKLGVRGVFYDVRRRSYIAKICKDGSRQEIGHFSSLEEAKSAYASASVSLFGEFTRAS